MCHPSPAAPSSLTSGHIEELDGLRGIAILLVMLHHFWPHGGPLQRWEHLAHLGWIGVDLFFVISGFLITGILLRTRGGPGYYGNFYARRALRIFPLYYLFLAVLFLVIPLAQGGSYGETPFLRESGSPGWYVFYLGNLREALRGVEPAYFLAPLWSLSIEEQFYLAFPLVVAGLAPRRLRSLLLWLLVAAPLFRLGMLLLVPGNERIQYLATPARMDVLALGCLLALLLRTGALRLGPARATRLMLAGLAALGLAYLLGGLDRTRWFCRVLGYSLVGLTFAAVVLFTVLHRGRACTAWLRRGPLQHLGRLCYGVYLLQRPAEIVLLKGLERLHVPADPGSVLLMLAKCATAVAAAALSWRCFERRVLRLKARFSSPLHPARDAVTVPAVASPARAWSGLPARDF